MDDFLYFCGENQLNAWKVEHHGGTEYVQGGIESGYGWFRVIGYMPGKFRICCVPCDRP